jgi:cytoskeletal protein RodZ
MPEIGATLREARMHARIDISEIEAETKIRAKYLRALENEEWGLLPGPAYVRSFLRTYAEALDLDAKLLLAEYKLRHERPSDQDLMPIGPARRSTGRTRQHPPPRGLRRGVVVAVLIVALLGALFALGKLGDDEDTPERARTDVTSTTSVPAPSRTAAAPTAGGAPAGGTSSSGSHLVRLQIVSTGRVTACVQDATGRLRLPGTTLGSGQTAGPYRSRSFRVRLGNGNARLVANGRTYAVDHVSPVGYVVTRNGARRIDVARTPSCSR